MTVKSAPFLSFPLFSSSPKSTFSPPWCYPRSPAHTGHTLSAVSLFLLNPSGWEHNPSFSGDEESSVNIPSSLVLLFPPSCEIAVVSYGFLFLRDGRWVHVGVEATKHAVSAQHAGQHTQWASCGYDSCHVHINVLPVIKNMHTEKNKTVLASHCRVVTVLVYLCEQICIVKNLLKWRK